MKTASPAPAAVETSSKMALSITMVLCEKATSTVPRVRPLTTRSAEPTTG
jgi:hypothetical protein